MTQVDAPCIVAAVWRNLYNREGRPLRVWCRYHVAFMGRQYWVGVS